MLLVPTVVFAESSVDFNTDFLDASSSQSTDFTKFSYANYILPGTYALSIAVNKVQITTEEDIQFFAPSYNKELSIPCITKETFGVLGLKEEWEAKGTWLDGGLCLDPRSIPEMTFVTDLNNAVLNIGIAQAYIEYNDPDWDPPSRWDDGIPGIFIDYNANGRIAKYQGNRSDNNESSITTIGTMGANAGAWRLRADFESKMGNIDQADKSWRWNQIYAFRAIRSLSAKLMFGEQYLSSTLFNSFRYIGASLESDESMLPPKLTGYAPEISGVAKTNAKVVVRQDGRIIYQTEVAPGPFRIQDINSFGGGTMDVSIEEQDGSIQSYRVETSSLVTLTRPGQFIYKLATGKTSKNDHGTQGPTFALGSFSWGASNNTTVYGGILASGEYQNIALGLGRDFAPFGVLSANISYSRAALGRVFNNEVLSGKSYNITYSKQFDAINSQVTFAGYRFSERNYMDMNQFIDKRYNSGDVDNSKELYTIIFGTAFPEVNMNLYLNYSHQTYWNRDNTDQYNVTVSRNFDIGTLKNVTASLSAYKMKSKESDQDGVFFNLNIPLEGNNSSIGYSTTVNDGTTNSSLNYYNRVDDRNSYNLRAGTTSGNKGNLTGVYDYDGDMAALTFVGNYAQDSQASISMQAKGGLTTTAEGAALHRMSSPGSSRILVDTGGVKGVPISSGITPIRTNSYGKGVIASMQDYSRNNLNIDLDKLPDNVEALRSTQYATLTEGAIGYRKFQVIEGQRLMAIISTPDNQHPPFGATVTNQNNIDVGIVADDGFVYISGVKPSDKLNVLWDSNKCEISLPQNINDNLTNTVLLPCQN